MGNENSKGSELTKNGTIPEKHENGSVNGLSATIISNGLEIEVNSETTVLQNGEPLSLNLSTDSVEPDFVVVESDAQPAEAQIVNEIPEPTIQKEEVKKSKREKGRLFGKMFKKKAEPPADVESVQEKETSKDDQTDSPENPPAVDPQPELNSSGEETTTKIIIEHQEEAGHPHQRAETSTQTDRKTEADISTQTGDDDDTTVNSEGPVEVVVITESTKTEEDLLDESAITIAEEAIEETANTERSDNQTAEIIIEEVVVTENNVYENIMFRAERVEVTDNFEMSHCNPEEESINGPEDKILVEENKSEETVPLEVSSSLPKVVADCIEAVFAAVSESTDYTAINTSEPQPEPQPGVDEVITEDNGEGAGDMSADVVLIETTEPEHNVVTPEAGEENGVPPLDEESVTTVMETISEAAHEETDPTPANHNTSVEEPPGLLETEIVIMEGSAHEEVTSDDAVVVGDVPEMSDQDKLSPATDKEPETADKSEPSPVIISEDDVIAEAAIDVLSQEFEPNATTPQEPAADNGSPVEEEVITVTVFVPLSEEQEISLTIPEDPVEETVIPFKDQTAEEMNEEAIEALSNELETVPVSLEEATTIQESSTEEVIKVVISEEPLEERDMAEGKTEESEDVLAQTESSETLEQIPLISEEPAEEIPSPCDEDTTTEVLESIVESVVEAISEKPEVTENVVEEPENVHEDAPPMEATEESEPCVSVQEELMEENVSQTETLLEDPDKNVPPVADVEVLESIEPTDENPVDSEERVEESEPQPNSEVLMLILKTTEDKVTEEIHHKTDNSGDVSGATEENSEVETLDEPVAECVEAVLESTVEEIIGEEAECNLATSEEVIPETTGEEAECNLATSEEVIPEIIGEEAVEEPPALFETEIVIMEGSAYEELTSDDAVVVGDVPEMSDQDKLSPATEKEPETADKSEPSPVIISEDDVIAEAAIDVLSQEFEPNATTPQEPAADNGSPVEEEVITVTVFVPLSEEQEISLTIPEDPVEETVIPFKDQTAEEMNEEAIEALSNEA
ncbi:breast carcinoma-amplified sequence 1 isoform X1 [Lates calcarifer]|uniref:Breast carcinoma-amplified sequence 1 isoform X1 n=1 Tax=Lates calcarifer TaxID=8187 RepID=A0AAJ8DQ46_LATCA|nr:breast carcinoma-amplified sequence 1 isoform X1 [Lates calcarifer]